jgi:thymidylate synthase ThyX
MSRKRAKESARLYLPYGNQLTADVMFNFRSFYHFVKLRYSSHAQLEIRNIAKDMLDLVNDTGAFNNTLDAFGLTIDGMIRKPFE